MVPLKPPQQWVCSRCTWRHGVVMKSDVLLPKPDCCPKCGGEVVLEAASAPEVLGSLLDILFRR